MEELTAKIDLYLSGKMNPEEARAFENEIDSDKNLRDEVELQQKTFALLEAAAIAQTREKVNTLNKQKSRTNVIRPLLRVAAVLLLLIIPTYFYTSSQFNDAHLYEAYTAPYPDRITTMGENVDTEINTAMNLYNSGSYEKAAAAFEKIRGSGRVDENIILYESVSLTNSNQAIKAVLLLRSTIASDPTNKTALDWQLILSMLANEEGAETLVLVENFLKTNGGYQQEKAEQLLSDLKSFWRK